MKAMAEVLFYHLERKPWQHVLPRLLSAANARGWRSVVQFPDEALVEEASQTLWASEADIFLAHGTEADGRAGQQPIWLTAKDENPNAANVRFFISGAGVSGLDGLARAIVIFDGMDETAVAAARAEWARLKTEGHEMSYWQQDENQRWVNRSAVG
jgi:DNA polymerase III subunit chi